METFTLASGSQQTHKDDSQGHSSTTPPPAYFPRSQLGSQLLAQLQQAGTSSPPIILSRPSLLTALDEVDYCDAESQEGVSAICLRINTSVSVSKNNNLVCLSDTPASHANAIARAVVQAIQENSSGQCGIPMIDEEGRPRPVKIEVDSGITVDGANNVVGNQEIISKLIDARKRSRAQDEEEHASPKRQRTRRGSS